MVLYVFMKEISIDAKIAEEMVFVFIIKEIIDVNYVPMPWKLPFKIG